MDTNIDCIFCKIINKELPCNKVYEDEDILAFLDITPVNIGHTLIIPKKHFANVYETPEETMCKMMSVTKKLSIAVKNAVNADGINIVMNNDHTAGQVIFHSHIHIIPRLSNDGFEMWHGKRNYIDHEKEEVAQKIISAL